MGELIRAKPQEEIGGKICVSFGSLLLFGIEKIEMSSPPQKIERVKKIEVKWVMGYLITPRLRMDEDFKKKVKTK